MLVFHGQMKMEVRSETKRMTRARWNR